MTSTTRRLTYILALIIVSLIVLWLLPSLLRPSLSQIAMTAPPTTEQNDRQSTKQEVRITETTISSNEKEAAAVTESKPKEEAPKATEQSSGETVQPAVPTISSNVIPIADTTVKPKGSVHEAVYKYDAEKIKFSIPVLNYHSVTVQPGNRAAIAPDKLAEQMQYLSDQGYTTLSLRQFIDIWEGRAKSPEKPVLLTFDDGYMDNYTKAMPILAKHQFRATMFMSPGMVDDGYFVSWEEAKAMHKAGWDIQPHGMTHPSLPKLSAEKQSFEIVEAKRQIEEQLGITADVFCYPYGERNETTLKILKNNGFRYAFTIDQGMAQPTQNPLLIRRLFVNGEEDLNSFKALLQKHK
ncbi:polysaccharide deacetylase family protein [Paenibacillus silviterrae]|uniref:polysaccharide deacetylase family protein n=1 Tax=Paenibacillus silviterrae TaxID=3242194 RepID=UPI002542FE61|nr:polysaccharide deacetylase family protein [Paenibacillus chinjuensis]